MKIYNAKKVNSRMTVIDERWEAAELAKVDWVWEHACPSPYITEARLVHSEEGLTALLSSNEWPLRVTHYEMGAMICEDSCLEFFLIPSETDQRYLNFEVNPAGTMHLRIGPDRDHRDPIEFEGSGIEIRTMVEPLAGWRAMIFIPYSFLNGLYGHCDKTMHGNFYKCGDFTVKEHYSMWNPIEVEIPDYHRPDFFGKILLSDEEI